MRTTSGSHVDAKQDALDSLLARAPRYAPPEGFAQRVIDALHEQEAAAASPRPWYLRPYSRAAAAAAACIFAALCLLPQAESPQPLTVDALAVDDALLVDEVLDAIDDPDLISAICSVSTGSYSISTAGSSAY